MSQATLDFTASHELPRAFMSPSKIVGLSLGLLLVVVICLLDTITGGKTSVLPLYLLPVIVSTWLAGRSIGLFITFLSSVAWFVAQIFADDPISDNTWDLLQNGVMRLAVFFVVHMLVVRLLDLRASSVDMTRYDQATRLPNRAAFFYRSTITLGQPQTHNRPLALILVDIIDLHSINRRFGQQRGDLALELTAHAVRAAKRPDDIVARIGGDEFALLMPITGATEAAITVDTLKRHLAQVELLAGCEVRHNIVVAQCDRPPLALEDLLTVAEGAVSTNPGVNNVHFTEAAVSS
ncbi:MAG: GGDEF domain-containing protein [Phycisphaerales bacterium]|nr:GGDEF domain-containing protein [Phycisphaerales bacterium]